MILETFETNGEKYQIEMLSNGNEITVRAMQNGKPANGYPYRVTNETAHDFAVFAGQDVVKELVKVAKSHVQEQLYEKLIKTLKQKNT